MPSVAILITGAARDSFSFRLDGGTRAVRGRTEWVTWHASWRWCCSLCWPRAMCVGAGGS